MNASSRNPGADSLARTALCGSNMEGLRSC